MPEIIDRGVGLVRPRGEEGGDIGIGKAAHHAQAEPDCEAVPPAGRFQRAIPARGIDADRPNIDAMIARIADDLGRCVKTRCRATDRSMIAGGSSMATLTTSLRL